VWALFCTVFFFARVIPTLASADLSLLLICSEPFLSRSVGVNYYVSCAKLYKVSAVLRHSSPSDVCVPWHLYVYVCMCVCCVRRTLPIWQTCWDGMCGYMACVVTWHVWLYGWARWVYFREWVGEWMRGSNYSERKRTSWLLYDQDVTSVIIFNEETIVRCFFASKWCCQYSK
jgi:hypothetical protein